MNDCIISTRQLSKSYGSKPALEDFSIDITSGNITGLIGRNGSGKTTLMKLLAGQLDSTDGEIRVFSEKPMDHLKVLQNLVYTYHNYKYPKGLLLSDILSYYSQLFDTFDKVFAEKLLKYFDLKPSMKYHQLSQGMASVFNFICGLSCRTKLTMFDEPVLGMDVSVRKAVYEVLLRDYSEHPRSFIISSHLISEIEGVLSDIILIENGKLVLYDSIDTIREYAYRVDGTRNSIDSFIPGKEVIYSKAGDIGSYSILRGSITEDILNASKNLNLELSQVRVEDLFVYLTKQNKEVELECLWEAAK
jgi:ABC-2 type transport system ATP-binding protein